MDAPVADPSTYLVVVRRFSAGEKYKFVFVKKVEGRNAAAKEDSFVFSVSPLNPSYLTNKGREQENDALYQLMSGEVTIESEGKVTIESESEVTIESEGKVTIKSEGAFDPA